jgi:hypothetical protein
MEERKMREREGREEEKEAMRLKARKGSICEREIKGKKRKRKGSIKGKKRREKVQYARER